MTSANRFIPGIAEFPELEQQLEQRLATLARRGGCSNCERAKVIKLFRQRLASRQSVTKGQNNRNIGP